MIMLLYGPCIIHFDPIKAMLVIEHLQQEDLDTFLKILTPEYVYQLVPLATLYQGIIAGVAYLASVVMVYLTTHMHIMYMLPTRHRALPV